MTLEDLHPQPSLEVIEEKNTSPTKRAPLYIIKSEAGKVPHTNENLSLVFQQSKKVSRQITQL